MTVRPEAVVLAGGRSSRMKTDKALLDVGGTSLLAAVCGRLNACCVRTTVVVADERRHAYASVLTAFGDRVRVVGDVYPGCGPLAGVHAGLKAADADWVFVVACDMPVFSASLFEKLCGRASGAPETADAIVCGGQPFFALYRRRCYREAERLLERGERRMSAWLETLRTIVVDASDEEKVCFLNLNAPEDYAAFLARAKPDGGCGDGVPPKVE